MTIGGISGNTNAGAGAGSIGLNQGMDAYSKSLQQQIADAQKQLQELSKNNELDPETKMKKRQEIQKQISDLNAQLRQHQIEERRKASQEKKQKNQPEKAEENMTGMSQNSMEAIISAESSLKQAKIQGDTANQMQNTADIKKSEIKRDGGGAKRTSEDSASISKKWDEVEGLEQKVQAAAISQMSSLAEAGKRMSDAAKADSSTNAKTEDKVGAAAKVEIEEGAAGDETKVVTEVNAETEASTVTVQSAEIGSNVDVKI